MFQSRVTVHTHTILPSLCGGDTTCNVTDGGGGAASSEHTANSVGGNEASVWPLIGTQSSAGVWLSAGRGGGRWGGSQRGTRAHILFRGHCTVQAAAF